MGDGMEVIHYDTQAWGMEHAHTTDNIGMDGSVSRTLVCRSTEYSWEMGENIRRGYRAPGFSSHQTSFSRLRP